MNSNLMDESANPIYWINLMYELCPHAMTLILKNAKWPNKINKTTPFMMFQDEIEVLFHPWK
jgi:hypothetical protein